MTDTPISYRERAAALLGQIGIANVRFDTDGQLLLAQDADTTLCLQAFDELPLIKLSATIGRLPEQDRYTALRAVLELNLWCVTDEVGGTLSVVGETGAVVWSTFMPICVVAEDGAPRDLLAAELGWQLDGALGATLQWRVRVHDALQSLARQADAVPPGLFELGA